MKKITEETIKKDYVESEVCMGELLASEPADGMTIEEAFEMYVRLMNYANGDEYYRVIGECVSEFDSTGNAALLEPIII